MPKKSRMEKVWDDPVADFWVKLHNECVDKLVNDPEKFLLKHMRYDHKMVREYQKRFGRVWAEYGTDIYRLIAEACGECWDMQDEEKKEAAVNQRIEDDNLVAAREEDPRGREHELQGKPEASVGLLEEGRCSRRRKGSAEEAAPKEKSGKSRRGEDFYRRAGSN